MWTKLCCVWGCMVDNPWQSRDCLGLLWQGSLLLVILCPDTWCQQIIRYTHMFLSNRYAILMSPNKGSSVWRTYQSVALPSLLDDWGGGDYWLPSIGLRSPSLLRHQYWCGKLVWRKNPVIICLSMSIMLWIFLTHCFAIVFDNCVIWSDYVIVWAVQNNIHLGFSSRKSSTKGFDSQDDVSTDHWWIKPLGLWLPEENTWMQPSRTSIFNNIHL